ncbi:hypothetical protein GCM10018777_39940 [Streptomyces albogriseolus]|nr:hypothetical protein GCM10018777_39940 [Streptomyces viridodiastaticus]
MSAASHRISRLEPYLDRPEPAPTLLKMLVGVQLAGFREDAGLSQDQAARSVGFSGAKLSRIESGKGRRPPAETDVRALLELYGTDDYEASVLLKLLQRAGEPGWWQRYDKRLMPEWFDRLVGLQEAAATIRSRSSTSPGCCRPPTTPARSSSADCPTPRRARCSAGSSCACAAPSCCSARTPRSCGPSSTSRSCCASSATAP